MKNIKTTVLKCISDIKGNKIENINLSFEEDLGFDSISYINLVSILSDELNINILEFNEDELRLKFINDLVILLEKKAIST